MKAIVTAFLVLFLGSALFAADVWVVQGYAQAATPSSCAFTTWTGDVLLFNTNATPASIALLGTSDVPPQPERTAFSIGPNQAVTLNAQVGFSWMPPSRPPIWVDHLDVPNGVRVESRLELGATSCFPSSAGAPAANGKLSFPLVRSLAPAGTRQLFLGADNGGSDSRVNVGVYNAGAASAFAHVEIHRACDDAVLTSQDVTVPANEILQVSLSLPLTRDPCADSRASAWSNYAMITVDQPSFAYVSTLSNNPLEINPPVLHIPAAISFTQ